MAASIAFQATDTDNTNLTTAGQTWTFALTVASAVGQERLVAVGAISQTTNPQSFSSVTIDGQSATQVGTISRGANDGTNNQTFLTFYRAAGTSGTNINVVATIAANGGTPAGYCALWTLNDADTVLATTNAAVNDPTLSTNTATGGVAAAALLGYSATSPLNAWTGLTENFDAVRVFGDEVFSGASVDVATGATPRTISVDTTPNLTTTPSIASICISLNPEVAATTDGVGSATATSTASAVGSAISVMTPDADITDGGWLTDTGGTSLFAAIDETVASDTDYIVSSDTATDTCEIRLSDPSATVARPFSVAYRYKRIGSDDITLRVALMEGATQRASWDTAVSSGTFTDAEQFLTAPEFAAITDFTDLRVRFTAIRESTLGLEGDFSGDLTLEGDFSGSLLLEGS